MKRRNYLAGFACSLSMLGVSATVFGMDQGGQLAEKSLVSASRTAWASQPRYRMDSSYKLASAADPLGNLPYAALIGSQAREAGLDPALLHAVVKVESGYNALALSPKGAVGLMQLMPETARRYGVRNSRDPLQNMAGGAAYLRDLLGMFGQDLPLALAAFNAGEGEVIRRGHRIPPFAETRAYIPKVLMAYDDLLQASGRHRSPYQLAHDWQSLLAAPENR